MRTLLIIFISVLYTDIVLSQSAQCPNGDGYYPDTANACRKFYVCQYSGTSNQKIYSFDCPSGLLFSSVTKVCDWSQNVNCNSVVVTITSQCPNGNGYYPDIANSCRKFYICLNAGTTSQLIYSFDCPSGLLFNRVSKVCDWPQNVICA